MPIESNHSAAKTESSVHDKRAIVTDLIALALAFSCIATSQTLPIQTNVPHLKDVYAHDFNIGCLLSYPHVGFSTDPYVTGQSAVVDTNGGYLIRYHTNVCRRETT
jgi:hypothetical protein